MEGQIMQIYKLVIQLLPKKYLLFWWRCSDEKKILENIWKHNVAKNTMSSNILWILFVNFHKAFYYVIPYIIEQHIWLHKNECFKKYCNFNLIMKVILIFL